MAIFALIPAAGSGSRVGHDLPKQYQQVAGKPLIAHALAAFAAVPEVQACHVVIAPHDAHFERLGLPAGVLRVGAASRHQSVLNGLDALTAHIGDGDWVMVHDAARPGLTAELIHRLIAALHDDPVGGLLALPLADTLKRARDGLVLETVPRSELWQAQTPQMFRYGLLRRALRSAVDSGLAVTDEASAIEALGLQPRLVQGSVRNFKVTWPEDLRLAQALLTEHS